MVVAGADNRKEYPMKPFILACLLGLCGYSLSLAATDCKVVEYPDRTEVECVGDEIARPEPIAPAGSLRSAPAEKLAQEQVHSPAQTPETASPAVRPRQAPVSADVKTPPSPAPLSTTDKAVEQLAKRRGMAARNTRNLTNYTTESVPSGQ
jgi:hypothetical protein